MIGSNMKLKFGFKNPINLRPRHQKAIKKILKKKEIFKVLAYALLAVLLGISLTFAWFAKDLPTPAKISKMKPSQSTKIFDRNGVLLYETGEVKRTLVTSDAVPNYAKQATVSIEDQQFYQNHGLNFRGIARAVINNIFHISGGVQGGSTITQQYVKNALLYQNRTLARKIKEAILAIELEFMYSKDQILTMYLNEIPYGGQTAGIEAASRMYYGKAAKDLTLSQAATLAAIPKAPTYYSPYGTHTEKLITRRNYVLDQMVKMKYITNDQADAAKKEDTTTVGSAVQPRKMSILAPHFSLYVLEQAAEEYGEQRVEKEGMTIYTTLDYEKQKVAEQAVVAGMPKVSKYGGSNAGLVSIDPKTGEVLTMVGSKDFFDTSIDGNVNIATSNRQPGSSFKPYVYATAFKKKEFSPSTILFDLTTDFGGGYVPQNYDGNTHGPVTMRQALANSLNIPAVKTTSLAGIDDTINTASDLGISTLTQKSRYGLSLGLGVGEVKLLEHTGGFSVFANGGVKHDVKAIRKVVDNKGKTLYEYKPEEDKGKQVLDPQIAYEMQNIMSDNAARAMVFGTRSPLYFPDRPVGAKTGTTSDFRDAWTVGYTPSLAVGVWTGNNDNSPMSRGADGSIIAAPIFHDFMAKMMANQPVEQFPVPKEIQTVTVERYSNKLPTEYSKETTTDIFASWQVPKDRDNVNAAVRVCKSNGLKAPDGTPDAITEIKVFSNVHSERPDNPNWEGPVRDWAIAAGLFNPEPAGTCDIGPNIVVSIISPTADQTVSGTKDVSATTNSPGDTSNIEFFIDNVSIGSKSSSPFTVNFNFNGLSTGRHTLKATATGNNGTKDSIEIAFFSVKNDFTISGVASSDVSSSGATISWITSATSTTQVFYDTISHSNYNDYLKSSTKNSALVTSHATTLSSLDPNTTYHFRVVSQNGSGDIISSDDYSFKTIL
jgi:1A family penicillin-binding protein